MTDGSHAATAFRPQMRGPQLCRGDCRWSCRPDVGHAEFATARHEAIPHHVLLRSRTLGWVLGALRPCQSSGSSQRLASGRRQGVSASRGFTACCRPLLVAEWLQSNSVRGPMESPECRCAFPDHSTLMALLLPSQFWPIPSMSRRVINCEKLCLSHPFGRIKWIRQWAVDRDPVLTSTTSAKIGKTAISSGKWGAC